MAESNSLLSAISLDNYQIGDGTVSLKIIDLERKVNINTANATTIQQALKLMGVDANDISVVSDSILDWIDPDDLPRVFPARRAIIIKVSPCLTTPKTRRLTTCPNCCSSKASTAGNLLGRQRDESPARGVSTQTRLWHCARSSARLSVRTGGDFHAVFFRKNQHQHRRRERPANDSWRGCRHGRQHHQTARRSRWRGRHGRRHAVPERQSTRHAGLNRHSTRNFGNLCTVRSSTFEVHVTAQIGDYKREYVAILSRNSGTDIQVLSFYWK